MTPDLYERLIVRWSADLTELHMQAAALAADTRARPYTRREAVESIRRDRERLLDKIDRAIGRCAGLRGTPNVRKPRLTRGLRLSLDAINNGTEARLIEEARRQAETVPLLRLGPGGDFRTDVLAREGSR